jgi:hypothetical protein
VDLDGDVVLGTICVHKTPLPGPPPVAARQGEGVWRGNGQPRGLRSCPRRGGKCVACYVPTAAATRSKPACAGWESAKAGFAPVVAALAAATDADA